MAERVHAALIGLSAPHSQGWLETLRHCECIERLVVCAAEGARPEVPEGVAGAYASVEELLQEEALHFGLVCMRNDQAPQVGARLIEAGIPCIIEKPVARSAAEILRLNELAAGRGVLWATAFQNRCVPAAREFKRLVDEGALGRILSIEARLITSSVQQRDPGHWLFSKELAGGGILHWLAVHSIDLVRYISGLEFAAVAAQVATLSGTDIDVEDMASLSFAMDNGALGTLHAGYVLRQRYGDIYLGMRGTQGEIAWSMWDFGGRGNALEIHSEAPGWETLGYEKIALEPREAPGYGGSVGIEYVSNFIAAARQGRPFVSDGKDPLRAMQVIEAAYAASAGGLTVELELN